MPRYRDDDASILTVETNDADGNVEDVFQLREPDPEFSIEQQVVSSKRIPLVNKLFEFTTLPDGSRRATDWEEGVSDADRRTYLRDVRDTENRWLVHCIVSWTGEGAVDEGNAERLPGATRDLLLREIRGLRGLEEDEVAPLSPPSGATTPSDAPIGAGCRPPGPGPFGQDKSGSLQPSIGGLPTSQMPSAPPTSGAS